MVLYARLDRSAVEGLARRFGIGDITTFSVIDGGSENTSYCVETSSGRYVLTIFDQQSLKEVTNLANLLVYLSDQGFRTSRVVVPPKEPIVIVGVCRDRKGISFEKAGRFIRGYQKQITLQSIERETLKTFAVYAAVATSFWHFRHHHLRRLEPRLYNKHVEMQTLADTISEYPDSSFMELCAEKTTAATSGELA